jgi:hypothetical protein
VFAWFSLTAAFEFSLATIHLDGAGPGQQFVDIPSFGPAVLPYQ